MNENEFWAHLAFRLSREVQGFGGEDRHLRYMWCDGLRPDEYDLADDEPQIRGKGYFGYSGQVIWRFALIVGRGTKSADQIDWEALLPDERLTGWLRPDPETKTLRIDPLSGYDDGS
jgi:hypothetical protein